MDGWMDGGTLTLFVDGHHDGSVLWVNVEQHRRAYQVLWQVT